MITDLWEEYTGCQICPSFSYNFCVKHFYCQ